MLLQGVFFFTISAYGEAYQSQTYSQRLWQAITACS